MSDIEFNQHGAKVALKRGVMAFILLSGVAWLMSSVGLAAIFSAGQVSFQTLTIMFLVGIALSIVAFGYIIEWIYENVNGKFMRRGSLDVSKRGIKNAAFRGSVALAIWTLFGIIWFSLAHVSFSNPISSLLLGAFEWGNPMVLLSLAINLLVTGYIVEWTYENIG